VQQYPYSVLPLGLGIEWFHLPVEDDQAPGEAIKTAWAQHHPLLRQFIGQFDTQSNSH
jgi:hypothetical protein